MVDTLIDTTDINPVLNEIMLAELAGVVRYTHYSLVITGPNRLPLVKRPGFDDCSCYWVTASSAGCVLR